MDVLVKKKFKSVHTHLHSIGCDVSYFATDWFLCLFCKTLPPETTARVWDALLLEGPKVLFRVALAIVRGARKDILAADNPGDVLMLFKGVQAKLHDRWVCPHPHPPHPHPSHHAALVRELFLLLRWHARSLVRLLALRRASI